MRQETLAGIWRNVPQSTRFSSVIRSCFRLPLVLALLSPLGAGAQTSAGLELRSLDGASRVITSADLEGLPRYEVNASAHRVTGRYAGVVSRYD
jgi:hypothetical protein